eukprot:6174539-Pleurochrysis_carterae.AAC.1
MLILPVVPGWREDWLQVAQGRFQDIGKPVAAYSVWQRLALRRNAPGAWNKKRLVSLRCRGRHTANNIAHFSVYEPVYILLSALRLVCESVESTDGRNLSSAFN